MGGIEYVILAIVILIVVFFIFREINCWYWKINESISLQKRNNELLSAMLSKMGGPNIAPVPDKPGSDPTPVYAVSNEMVYCSDCGKKVSITANVCPHCGYNIAANRG